MKIAIFTRTGFHHTSFINRLQDKFEIACIVREAYPESRRESGLGFLIKNVLSSAGRRRINDRAYLREFDERFSAGFRYHRMLKDFLKAPFDLVVEKSGAKYLNVRCGEINTEGFLSFIRGLRPDIVAVLGSSVISGEVISVARLGMVNLHSGLSPYYRGTWSYGWPVVNNEPQYIGATVHHIDPGIDTGDVIYQTRPVFQDGDDLNVIFLKVIAEGTELVSDAIETMLSKGKMVSYKQPKGMGRHYCTRDFNADTARRCLNGLEEGIIGRYNASKQSLDSKVSLLGYIPPRLFV